jgi:hypothetical protein
MVNTSLIKEAMSEITSINDEIEWFDGNEQQNTAK